MSTLTRGAAALAVGGLVACADPEPTPTPVAGPPPTTIDGVDADAKVVHLGVLGPSPAATADTVHADRLTGLRMAMARAAAPGSAWLPDGWSVALHAQEHDGSRQGIERAYDRLAPQVAAFALIHDARATMLASSWLERDGLYAFPDDVTQELRGRRRTPMIEPPPALQARRALDHVRAAGDAAVRPAIVHDATARGSDALAGWSAAAENAGLALNTPVELEPRGPNAARAAVAQLIAQDATHVLLAARPGVARDVIKAAADVGYTPAWLGISTTWNDVYFRVDDPELWATYARISPWPWWGEDVPGAEDLQAAWAASGRAETAPTEAVLVGWVHAQAVLGAVASAIADQNVTRTGIGRAIIHVDHFDADGMIQPISLSQFPYTGALAMRVLTPDFESRAWTVASDWAVPAGFATPTQLDSTQGRHDRDAALEKTQTKRKRAYKGSDPLEIVSGVGN